jgi:hypothetical protein
VTDPTCNLIGKLKVDLSEAMELPLAERSVRLSLVFGEVQIKALAVVEKTRKVATVSLDFTPMN